MSMLPGYDDKAALAEVLAGARDCVARLGPLDGQQLAALCPPRPGYPESDEVRFTAETCETVYNHLRANGIRCVRVRNEGHPTARGYCIVFAATLEGLKTMLERARKSTRQQSYTRKGLRLTVIDDPDEPQVQ